MGVNLFLLNKVLLSPHWYQVKVYLINPCGNIGLGWTGTNNMMHIYSTLHIYKQTKLKLLEFPTMADGAGREMLIKNLTFNMFT